MRCIKEYKSQRMTPEGGFLVKASEGFEDSGAGYTGRGSECDVQGVGA